MLRHPTFHFQSSSTVLNPPIEFNSVYSQMICEAQRPQSHLFVAVHRESMAHQSPRSLVLVLSRKDHCALLQTKRPLLISIISFCFIQFSLRLSLTLYHLRLLYCNPGIQHQLKD